MTAHKNIFAIARRGSENDEDQLTELLAYLIQQEPDIGSALIQDFGYRGRDTSASTQCRVLGGRLDLEFRSQDGTVVVESKLGSVTTFQQCKTYLAHLASASGQRMLVLLTKLPEAWPEGIEEEADAVGIELVRRRWWDITGLLRRSQRPLASDFAAMLEDEGLVIPDALKDEDWAFTPTIPPGTIALAKELRPKLKGLSRGFRRAATFSGRSSSYRSIYSLAYFARAQIGPGLAASWKDLASHRQLKAATNPIDGPLIAVSVVDSTLPESHRPAAADEAVSVGGDGVIGSCWGKFPTRAAPAGAVLTARTFLGQVQQALDYTRVTVEHFREIGYLRDTI